MSHRKQSATGGGQWSAKRQISVVLELRGANLEATSRKHRVTIRHADAVARPVPRRQRSRR